MVKGEIPSISVVVPLYSEGRTGVQTARRLLGEPGWQEIVLAVAGETEATMRNLWRLADESNGCLRLTVCANPGRASQMNLGAEVAGGDILLFLHADTLLPANAPALIRNELAGDCVWGRFKVRLAARGLIYRIVEGAMNWRSLLSGIATGDQAIFVYRSRFLALGGYPDIALMEDIEISRRLKHSGRPAVISLPALTSARRWQRHGALPTILLMWRLRFLHWLGTDPEKLAKQYRDAR